MKKHKLFVSVLASAVCLASVYSCQDELGVPGSPVGSIKVKIDAEEMATRSAGSDEMTLTQTMVMNEDSLLLMEYVCDNRSVPFYEVVNDTRSASVTTADLNKVGGVFGMQAFLDNYDEIDCEDPPTLTDNDHYIVNGRVAYIDAATGWNFTDGSGTAIDYKWLYKMFFTFWSYYPKDVLEGSDFGSSSTGRHTMSIDDYTVATSSDDQKDLLVAYNNRYSDDKNENEALSIVFKHILSEINFDFSAITTAGYSVDKIEIIGAIGQGDCAISGGTASTTAEVGAPTSITWTPDGSKTKTFTMTLSTTEAQNNFFMIPQPLPTDTKIKITLTKSGKTETRESSLSTTWLPGKYYKYVLTYDPADYSFALKTPGDATTTFTEKNTTASVNKFINITSTKKKGSAAPENWDWDIQSYQIGSGTEVPVASTATSITAEDLVITEDLTNNRLKVESKKWIGIDKGGHDYWTNADGKSETAWVAEDWSSTKAKSSSPLDLSEFDFQSETVTTMNTANCYIVRHAGTYKIPLVYGNGVVNGAASTAGYVFTGGLTNFINHKGSNISSPFIENNTDCTASSAAIVWQDRQEDGKNPVIQNVSLTGSAASTYDASNVRYIQFTVSPSDIRQTNAVIAVKNSTTTMWSWHIWVTNDPAILSGPISVTNHTGDSYGFFPSSSLGWIEPKFYEDREDVTIKLVQKSSCETITVTVKQTKPDKLASSGVVYQWGRKDPFPTESLTSVTSANSQTTLATAIQNPNKFYAPTSKNWCSTNYTNLWAGKYTGYSSTSGTSTASNLTSKTIYDPSPVGYKVPSIFAYSGFSTTGNDPTDIAQYNIPTGTEFDMGWNFNTGTVGTIFFDASGWSTSGTIESKGQEGNYHSALLYSSTNNYITYWAWGIWAGAYYMHMTNTTPTHLGASVRPVTE